MLRHVARKVVRTAVSALCKEMLQPGQCAILGLHEMEEVEVRLRALARLEPIWGNSEYGDSGSSTQLGPLAIIRDRYASASALEEEIERKLFAGALRDGYVLCQWVSSLTSYPRHVFGDGTLTGFLLPFHVVRLMNKLRPRSIEKIEPREDGIFLSSNMTKFFSSCIANGFPPKDLFSRDDLIRAKTPSLARVANTILALLKWAERPAQTRSHDLHCEEETTKPKRKRRMHQPTPVRRSKIGADNTRSIHIPPRGRIHVSNPHSKSNKSHVQVTCNHRNTRSMRNQSSPYSMTNQSGTRWRSKHSFTPRNATTATSKRSSLLASETNFGNQSSFADKLKIVFEPCVSRTEEVSDSPVMSTECTSTCDGTKSWRLFFFWEDGKARRQFVGVSFLIICFWSCWLILVCLAT